MFAEAVVTVADALEFLRTGTGGMQGVIRIGLLPRGDRARRHNGSQIPQMPPPNTIPVLLLVYPGNDPFPVNGPRY